MQKSTKILFLLFLLTGILYYLYVDELQFSGNSIIEREVVEVKRVIDGDTLELKDSRKVRLLGINTPEKKSFLYQEALNFTNQLQNKSVILEVFSVDRYGRILGYVFLYEENFNLKILEQGYGHTYYYGEDKYKKEAFNLEKLAMEKEKGIWKKSNNHGCLKILKFEYYDKNEDNETLILENICNINLNVEIKDDATHIYREEIKANSEFLKITQNIWNDDGDSLYVWDDNGLILFFRY